MKIVPKNHDPLDPGANDPAIQDGVLTKAAAKDDLTGPAKTVRGIRVKAGKNI